MKLLWPANATLGISAVQSYVSQPLVLKACMLPEALFVFAAQESTQNQQRPPFSKAW